jgi:endoglucanase
MNKIMQILKVCAITLAIGFGPILSACSEKESAITPEVVLAKTEFTIPNNGGTETLSIQSNIPLTVVSADETWCTVEKIDGTSKKVVSYAITAAPNTITESRQTKITVSGSGYSAEVSVTQTAGDFITVTNEVKTYECDANGGEFTVNLTSTSDYTITNNSIWIALVEKTASSAKFSVAPNLTSARTTAITFTCGNSSAQFEVKQGAGSNGVGGDNAMAVAQSLGLGWNLGNQLDAHNNGIANETSWGNLATTQDAFNKIAASGIRTVRIPVTWLGKVGPAPTYTIDAAWMNRVAEVVGYAETAGLNAIINIHHDGADSHYWLDIKNAALTPSINTQVKAQLSAMWTQIANKFKDKSDFLIFESMNEIHDGGWGWGANKTDGGKQYAVLNEWNQVFVDAVRATGGNNSNRYLGVPGYVTNIDLTVNHFILPTDVASNRLMVSVHYYTPSEFALEDKFSEWGHTGATGKKATYGDEDEVKSKFAMLKTKYVDKGIPVYIGEMGCVHKSAARAELFRKYYLEYVCKAAKTYGLAPVYWDNGSAGSGKESLGLLNHATGNYLNNGKEMIDVMAKAVSNDDPTYTLESVYNSAPQ